MASVLDKIKEMIVSELNVELDEITLDSRLQEDLGADSIDAVELIMNVEEEFDLEISDEVLQNLNTVNDLVVYIEKELA